MCGDCHPFFTGVERQAPRGGRIERFERGAPVPLPRSSDPAGNNPVVMTTYIALLRGINVGGNRKIRMADLREIFAEAGCADVASYIQSGNVVFTHLDGRQKVDRGARAADRGRRPVSTCR